MAANAIYSKIKSVRELKNFTQEYMAVELEISQPAYNKIESGKTALTYEKLEDIARILDVSLEDIIGFDSRTYFKSFSLPKASGKDCDFSTKESMQAMQKLYEDKIMLLERLLEMVEAELAFYKKKEELRHCAKTGTI